MRNLGHVLVGAAVLAAAFAGGQANAAPIDPNGSLTISVGSVTLTPGPNILSDTTSKTIGTLLVTAVGGNLGASGVTNGEAVSISPSTISIPPSLDVPVATSVIVTVGSLTFDFTTEELTTLTPQTSGVTGFLNLAFFGSFSDSSGTFNDSTASMGESCSQGAGDATTGIACSESIAVPGVPIRVPEPATLALLGSALVGFGVFRRKANRG